MPRILVTSMLLVGRTELWSAASRSPHGGPTFGPPYVLFQSRPMHDACHERRRHQGEAGLHLFIGEDKAVLLLPVLRADVTSGLAPAHGRPMPAAPAPE